MTENPYSKSLTDLKKRLEAQQYPLFFAGTAELSAILREEDAVLSASETDGTSESGLTYHLSAYRSLLQDALSAMQDSFSKRRQELSEIQDTLHAACEDVLSHPLFRPSAGVLFTVPEKDRTEIALSALSLAQRIEACMRTDQISRPPVPSTFPARTQAMRALCCLYRDDITAKCMELLNTVASETQKLIEAEKINLRLYHLSCEVLMMLTEFRSEALLCLSFRENGDPTLSGLPEIQRLSLCIKTHRTRLSHILKSKLEEMENSYEALHTRA